MSTPDQSTLIHRGVRAHDAACSLGILQLVLLAARLDRWRKLVNRQVPRLVRWLRGSLKKLRQAFLRESGAEPEPRVFCRRRAHNRIPPHVEEEILRLHLGWPSVGAGQLVPVLHRILGVELSRETIRRVIRRNQDTLAEMFRQRRRVGRFHIDRPRTLWGVDLTLGWVLGFVPLWVAAIVDYHGSYLIALEPLPWPSAEQVAKVFERAVIERGAPERVLTDRGSEFRGAFAAMLVRLDVEHTRTRPHHPWTNGRFERLFRTFKETLRGCFWVVESRMHWAELCAEFVTFYNDHRPHQSFGGLTPAEVWRGRAPSRIAAETTFFQGRLRWWRFS